MERDDLIKDNEYALSASHSEEEGAAIRSTVVKVTIILSLLTIVEVCMGVWLSDRGAFTWQMVKWGFIVMTAVKAGLIVMEFMHLGHEKRALKWLVLAPYIGFILYLAFICLIEATYIFTVGGGN